MLSASRVRILRMWEEKHRLTKLYLYSVLPKLSIHLSNFAKKQGSTLDGRSNMFIV